jgi:hypothetical protein
VSDVPAQPAAYVRVADATSPSDPEVIDSRDSTLRWIQDMGWPAPAVYADAGEPGSQLTALMEAISSGRHDAVFAIHPITIGDLAQIEALDLLCRKHAVRLLFRRGTMPTYPRALFDVIRHTKQFTVTDEHLRRLRRAYVWWDDIEFGAPGSDPKRPYGNSNVYGDIAEILNVPRHRVAVPRRAAGSRCAVAVPAVARRDCDRAADSPVDRRVHRRSVCARRPVRRPGLEACRSLIVDYSLSGRPPVRARPGRRDAGSGRVGSGG